MLKRILVLILSITIQVFCYGQSEELDSKNPRIQSRFEYVTCRFDKFVSGEIPDMFFSTHLKSRNDGMVYKIFISAQSLYEIFYPERSIPSQDLIYMSIGKMLIHDTIYLDDANIRNFKYYFVDEEKLNIYKKKGFALNYEYAVQSMEIYSDCMDNELGYYFDRLYYPAGTYNVSATSICKIDFDYYCDNFAKIYHYDSKQKKHMVYVYDHIGELVYKKEE